MQLIIIICSVINCETMSCTADISVPIYDELDVVTAHTAFGTRSGSAITNLGRITLLTSNISNICITSSASDRRLWAGSEFLHTTGTPLLLINFAHPSGWSTSLGSATATLHNSLFASYSSSSWKNFDEMSNNVLLSYCLMFLLKKHNTSEKNNLRHWHRIS